MSKERVIMNGCTAVTHVSYALSDAVVIFPISPASDMGELADVWSASEKENLMGQPVVVKEMESEAGAAGAVHVCLRGGALASTSTSSPGLLLLVPSFCSY